MGKVGRQTFGARALELAQGTPCLELIIASLFNVRDTLLIVLSKLNASILDAARGDPVTRTLMT